MLRSIEELEQYTVMASDGEVGQVRDLHFDDTTWVVRYLEVESGSWLGHRRLLIPPSVTGPVDWPGRTLAIALPRGEVQRGPEHCTPGPVARQMREGYIGPAGFPYRMAGPGSWSAVGQMASTRRFESKRSSRPDDTGKEPAPRDAGPATPAPHAQRRAEAPLRSANAAQNCRIRARDGVIGQVQGMLVEEEAWMVRFLIVQTSGTQGNHVVLIASPWILDADWPDASIRVDLTRKQVQESLTYAPGPVPQPGQMAADHAC